MPAPRAAWAEGSADAIGVVLTITADGSGTPSLERGFSFDLTTAAGGTATGGGTDYTLPATVSFASGALSGATADAILTTKDDTISEGAETANLGLSIHTGIGGQVTIDPAANAHTTTILDNDIDLKLIGTNPASVVAGSGAGNLNFTFTVQNTGLTDATNVKIGDVLTLPAGVTFDSGSAATGSFANDTWTIPTLAAGASTTISLLLTADHSTAQNAMPSAMASVASADQVLVNQGDDSASETGTITRQADLAVTITDAPDPVAPNHDLTYHLHLTNNGPSDASMLSLLEHLPQHATYVSATGPNGWSSTHTTVPNDTVTFTAGTLAAGGTADFTVVVHTAADSKGLTLTADSSVSATETDLTTGNNTAMESTKVAQALYAVANSQPIGHIRGTAPLVHLFNADGQDAGSFMAYEAAYKAGVRLAIGDVTGDGNDDIVTATASGTGRIRIFDGVTHAQVALGGKMELAAFTGKYQRGAYVALGDVDGDGRLDIVAGAGLLGGTVNIYSGMDGHLIRSDAPLGTGYKGEVRVAAADLDGDGKAEIISAQGTNGARVNVDFSGTQGDLDFIAGGRLTQGLYVTAADTTGDGVAEIIIGKGRLGTRSNAGIDVYQVTNPLTSAPVRDINSIALDNKTYLFSARVAAADLDGDGIAEIFAAPNYHGKSTVQIFDGASGLAKSSFTAVPSAPELGVFVAASVAGK